jgi:hypothetical protein
MNHELEKCIEALRELRSDRHSELNPSVRVELDRVLARFEACLRDGDLHEFRKARDEGLKVIARIIDLAVSVSWVVEHFLN